MNILIENFSMQVLETEHGTQGFYIDVTPVHRSVRVIIDERCFLVNNQTKCLLAKLYINQMLPATRSESRR